MWKPKYFQEIDEEHREHHDRPVRQPFVDEESEPAGLERPVDHPIRVEQQLEHDAGRGLGQYERREEQQPERSPAPEGPVELQRQPQGERDLDEQRQDDDEQVVPHGAPED